MLEGTKNASTKGEAETNVFVYGSLRQGFGNHSLLECLGARKLGEQRIAGILVNLGAYPGLIPLEEIPKEELAKIHKKHQSVFGEIYRIPASGLKILDNLEGFRGRNHMYNFYNRIKLRGLEPPANRAWVYHLGPHYLSKCPIVKEGKW